MKSISVTETIIMLNNLLTMSTSNFHRGSKKKKKNTTKYFKKHYVQSMKLNANSLYQTLAHLPTGPAAHPSLMLPPNPSPLLPTPFLSPF